MDLMDLNTIREICGRKNDISPEEISMVEVLWYDVLSVAEELFHFLLIHQDEQQRLRQCVVRTFISNFKKISSKNTLFSQVMQASILVPPFLNGYLTNHIEVKWPACSPDLNLMESLWGIRVCEIHTDYKQFHSTYQLKAAILNVWSKIYANATRNLLHSMNNLIFQLIQRNGNVIHY